MILKPLVAVAAAAGVLLSATPAQASDSGLYGAGEATYDGVYRQSLAILALKASGQKVPKDAVRWLKSQQCSDGGFMEYRPDTSDPCVPPAELNGTALAVAALKHTGNLKAAKKAAGWIGTKQNLDNGFAFFPQAGATSDASSTALAIAAMSLVTKSPQQSYLLDVQYRCDAPTAKRGGLRFDTTMSDVNDLATAQTAAVLGGALTLPEPTRIKKATPHLKCNGKGKNTTAVDTAALGWLSDRLVQTKGALPYGGGYPGTDYSATATGALALANAGVGREAVRTTVKTLKRDADSWITGAGDDSPGALALLILVAKATGENPQDFGGINLVKRLAATKQ